MKKPMFFVLSVICIGLCIFLTGLFLSRTKTNSSEERNLQTVAVDSLSNRIPDNLFLDVNSASFEELSKLPELTTVLARRIILYRQEHGSFSSLEELKKVEGITENILKKLNYRLGIGG